MNITKEDFIALPVIFYNADIVEKNNEYKERLGIDIAIEAEVEFTHIENIRKDYIKTFREALYDHFKIDKTSVIVTLTTGETLQVKMSLRKFKARFFKSINKKINNT